MDDQKFNTKLKELIESKPKMVQDFRGTATVDLPVDRINTKGEVQKLTSGEDFAKKIEAKRAALKASSGALDYNQLRKEFADKATAVARGNFKRPTLGGLAAGLATAVGTAALPESAMASTSVQAGLRALDEGDPSSVLLPGDAGPAPGSFDSRIENGTLTDEDKAQLRMQALRSIR